MQILYSYLRYTDRFLDVLFLLPAVILSELHENPTRKNWVAEKSTYKTLSEGHHFFGCTLFFLCHFLSLFPSIPLFRLLRFYVEKKFCSRKWWVGGGSADAPPAPPVSTALLKALSSSQWIFWTKIIIDSWF